MKVSVYWPELGPVSEPEASDATCSTHTLTESHLKLATVANWLPELVAEEHIRVTNKKSNYSFFKNIYQCINQWYIISGIPSFLQDNECHSSIILPTLYPS